MLLLLRMLLLLLMLLLLRMLLLHLNPSHHIHNCVDT
jgi:hypothetical protein